MTADLSIAESRTLARHEAVIVAGQKHFVAVGNALAAIRDAKLYRGDYATFPDYCRDRWGFNKSRAYQFIEAAAVLSELPSTIGGCELANERQARALAEVEPAKRAEVFEAARAASPTGKPTARQIKEAALSPAIDELATEQEPVAQDAANVPAPRQEPNTIGEAQVSITVFINDLIHLKPAYFQMAVADHLEREAARIRAWQPT